MTPQDFIRKWLGSTLTERAAAQSHFLDLCEMLGVPKPADLDPTGKDYGFEVGATKTTGGQGFADVFRRGFFAWEYKGTGKDLVAAFAQLQRYAVALDNPPLLIVSDIGTTIRIYTNWTNSVSRTYDIPIAELGDPGKHRWLLWALTDPDQLRPKKTRQQLTEEVAAKFADLARSLRARGHKSEQVAHFINRLIFCMFAEDVKLLPNDMFTRMLKGALHDPSQFVTFAQSLFSAMSKGGLVGFEQVKWFNGGLFDNADAFALTKDEIRIVHDAAEFHWGDVDASILGTLFERGLDPDKRSQLGAHYTDRTKIMQIVAPVVIEPLASEWEAAKAKIEELYASLEQARTRMPTLQRKARGTYVAARRAEATAKREAVTVFQSYLHRLHEFRILDPACGSGNFLNVALTCLKDLEWRASLEMEAITAQYDYPYPASAPLTGPENVMGIEINPYAAELARVSVWIGEIQWMLRNGFPAAENPVLKPLDNVECRDALVTRKVLDDGTEAWGEAQWPKADAIIGNPPFLGAKLMRRRLGTDETLRLRDIFSGRLPGFTDLVCYWFEKARALIDAGMTERAGLVATNSIRKNTNLPVLRRIRETLEIFEAWSEEKWTVEGAAVDVSLVCFARSNTVGDSPRRLDGQPVTAINPDLTTGTNLSAARPLAENRSVAFLGIQKSGPFDVPGETARRWLGEPVNVNGQPNSDVLRPYWNGDDFVGRPRDMWTIDLPPGLSEASASAYASPFDHLSTTPDEDGKLLPALRAALGTNDRHRWWEPWRQRRGMRSRIAELSRYIVTPETAQYRAFRWLSLPTLPDKNLIVIPREDDLMFGLLESRFHRLWASRRGSDLQDRPRYTHTTTLAGFPFPEGMQPSVPVSLALARTAAPAIATAARLLNEYRENWINPPNLVRRVPEVVPGYPDRIVPKDAAAEAMLRTRTLTNLYNERPAWLDNAHKALDAAVAAAYGWPADLTDEEILARLFSLNQQRARLTASSEELESEDVSTG